MSAPFFVLPPLLPLWKHQRQFRNLVKDLPCDYELNMRGLCIKDIGDLRFKYVLKEEDLAEQECTLPRLNGTKAFIETIKTEDGAVDTWVEEHELTEYEVYQVKRNWFGRGISMLLKGLGGL